MTSEGFIVIVIDGRPAASSPHTFWDHLFVEVQAQLLLQPSHIPRQAIATCVANVCLGAHEHVPRTWQILVCRPR